MKAIKIPLLLIAAAASVSPAYSQDFPSVMKSEFMPEIHGTIRAKYEYEPQINKGRFEIRNAQLSVEGKIDVCHRQKHTLSSRSGNRRRLWQLQGRGRCLSVGGEANLRNSLSPSSGLPSCDGLLTTSRPPVNVNKTSTCPELRTALTIRLLITAAQHTGSLSKSRTRCGSASMPRFFPASPSVTAALWEPIPW